jgi:hypothetical protein
MSFGNESWPEVAKTTVVTSQKAMGKYWTITAWKVKEVVGCYRRLLVN